RFRQVGTFGRKTVRRFGDSVGELKQFAAREYEDVLQCIIPVFEDLLPEPHNAVVLDLLFLTAYTHGLAKLWMHTDSSLAILRNVTGEFGKALRRFERVTCAAYVTLELPKEAAARARRHAKEIQMGDVRSSAASGTRKVRRFNAATYKIHAIGDYASTIDAFGTTDSYTTQIVSQPLRHCIHSLITLRRENKSTVEQKHGSVAPITRTTLLS
ncbi:hypothetical protein OE88DRAFT_1637606, partial [Heliocybe sulcata]